MCSYLLIGFWFTRPGVAEACQKAFIINCIGDFGLLLGILGFYWITGRFEFEALFERFNELLVNNENSPHFIKKIKRLLKITLEKLNRSGKKTSNAP